MAKRHFFATSEVRKLATEAEVQRAIGNVRSGNGSQRDYELAQKRAKVAGSSGRQAQEALREGAKRS